MSNIKVGCTLFCFSTSYIQGKMTLEDCVRTAAEIGCDGYEIVATQMLPHYPDWTDEDVGLFSRLNKQYGVAPKCYAANMDRGMRHDRDLTEDEMLAMAIRDVQNADRLGCRVMRQQYMMPPSAMVRLAPYAELYDVKVGIEIHNPESPTSPAMLEYLEAFKACGSKYIGFIPDFGCFATRPNKPHWDRALANGAQPELLEMAKQLRYDDVPQEETVEKLKAAGANNAVIAAVAGMYGFVQFRKQADIEGLKNIIPYTFEFHGKCHYVSEDLEEASIPYEQLVPVIAASGFNGYIMAEFEDEGGYDEVEMTRRDIAMIRKYMG